MQFTYHGFRSFVIGNANFKPTNEIMLLEMLLNKFKTSMISKYTYGALDCKAFIDYFGADSAANKTNLQNAMTPYRYYYGVGFECIPYETEKVIKVLHYFDEDNANSIAEALEEATGVKTVAELSYTIGQYIPAGFIIQLYGIKEQSDYYSLSNSIDDIADSLSTFLTK